jgi:hypothetical protein
MASAASGKSAGKLGPSQLWHLFNAELRVASQMDSPGTHKFSFGTCTSEEHAGEKMVPLPTRNEYVQAFLRAA